MVKRKGLRAWIAGLFPVFLSIPPTDSKRDAVIQLVSIGRLCETGINAFSHGVMLTDMVQLSKTMMISYREILMAEYNISETDLLPTHEVMRLAREMRNGIYKLPGTEGGNNNVH